MIGIGLSPLFKRGGGGVSYGAYTTAFNTQVRSEEHTSELQSH